MTLDIRALARAAYDPERHRSAYKDELKRLQEMQDQRYAAQFAKDGSIADRNNPENWGSIARRQYGDAFKPAPTPQPSFQDPVMPRKRKQAGMYAPGDFQSLYRDMFDSEEF